MNETDTWPMQRLWDVPAAFVLLTRLPVPRLPDQAFAHGARAVWAYPLVGLVLGGIAALVGGLATTLGQPALAAAGLVVGLSIMLTGAMHEDGLADTADGLWGGHDRARRLEIMKDSRIGAYGVLALIVAVGLRWVGLAEVSWPGLISAFVISRAMMPVLMLALPNARDTGLSHSVGVPDTSAVVAGALIAAVLTALLCGAAGLLALCIAAGVTAVIGAVARAKIGGQTGDILGATQVMTEIAVVLTLVALQA